jgi:hypothetical protein
MQAKLLHDMFFLGLPLAEKLLRPVIVYVFLVVALRVAGKRELGQLNPFDLVVLLTISNTVQNAIIGDDNSITGGVIGATTLLFVNHLVVRYLYSHERLDLIEEPDLLIDGGAIAWICSRRVDHGVGAERRQNRDFGLEAARFWASGSICSANADARRRTDQPRLDRLSAELSALKA